MYALKCNYYLVGPFDDPITNARHTKFKTMIVDKFNTLEEALKEYDRLTEEMKINGKPHEFYIVDEETGKEFEGGLWL